MKKQFMILTVMLVSSLLSPAQITIHYQSEKKSSYHTGELIEIRIQLKTQPQTCKDGMDRVKIFPGGLNIQQQSEWKRVSACIWQKTMTLEITGNSKKNAKLTILRKVDKEDLFYQEIFKIES